MRTDIWYDSKGAGKIHACRWTPEGEPRAVVQILHGIAEFVERYDAFAEYLNSHGFLVVAEDHMGHGQSINGDGIQGYFHGGWFTAVEDAADGGHESSVSRSALHSVWTFHGLLYGKNHSL